MTEQIVDRISKAEARIQSLELSDAVDKVHRANIDKRLVNIEDIAKWIMRLMIGALLSGVMIFAMSGGFNVG